MIKRGYGALGGTRTPTMLLTATSRQRVYQFRHERDGINRPFGCGPDQRRRCNKSTMGGQGPPASQIPALRLILFRSWGPAPGNQFLLLSQRVSTCPALPKKINCFGRRAKHRQISAHPVHQEGRIMIATNAGQDAVAAGLLAWRARNRRTVKPCGPVPPTLGIKPAKAICRRR